MNKQKPHIFEVINTLERLQCLTIAYKYTTDKEYKKELKKMIKGINVKIKNWG